MVNKIEKQNVQDIFELSMVQKGMLFHHLKNENGNTYNAQLVFTINGDLNVNTLQSALNSVQDNHDVLRSVFRWEEVSKPLQIILKKASIKIQYYDVSDKNAKDRLDYIEEYALTDQKRRFDLSQVPMRVTVIKASETSFVLCFTNHHILYDGWSTGILLKELFVNYNDLAKGNTVKTNQKVSYKRYFLSKQKENNPEQEYDYWKKYLEEYQITSCFSEKTNNDYVEGSVEKKKIKLNIESIKELSKGERITPTAIIYTAIGLLLQKLTGTSDIVLGTTVSGRDGSIEGVEHVVGNFINTIPLRITNKNNTSFLDIAKEVYKEGLVRNQNANTSYYEIKKLLELQGSEELFDVVVVVENYPLDEKAINGNPGFEVKLKSVYENTGIPLVVTVFLKEELEIELIYQPSIITTDEIDLFSVSLERILNQIEENPVTPTHSFELLHEEEKVWQIKEFNETVKELSKRETIVSLFDKQRNNTPDKVAVICGSEQLTYQELGDLSDKIATYLKQEKEIKKGDLVGLMLGRDFNLVPIILGVLKAGAAYVPIDPTYPIVRINNILKQSKLALLVTEDKDIDSSLNTTSSIIDVEDLMMRLDGVDIISDTNVLEDDLAYIIFTSGSTGTPKGVMIEHGTLLNYIFWASDSYVKEEELTFPLYSSISFDLTVTSIFTPLITGNTIIVYKDEAHQLPIDAVLNDTRINIVKLTPSHLKIIRDNDLFDSATTNIRKLIVGGEELEYHLAKEIVEKFNGDVTIYNEYGPTEATVGCMIYEFDTSLNTGSVPLGNPIYNTQIYILDPYMNPVPAGVKGELYIAGGGLARGYLGREDLTIERFVKNPFIPGKKMYKTGDYAIREKNNHILFYGRIDEQVKISGHRIELKEIEATLSTYPEIKESVVAVKEKDNNKILVAYYLSDSEVAIEKLKAHVGEKLPSYMLPMDYIRLESFPLTSNGKLDFKKLPEPNSLSANDYHAPTTIVEKLLVKHWSDVLNVPVISITDNYFLIGGDSIKSIQISSKMRADGFEVSVQDIFRNPTIKTLAAVTKPLSTPIDQSTVTGEVVLSPIQKWFFDNSKTDQHHFNQSSLLAFDSKVTPQIVQQIFSEILRHHDALRMVFKKEGVNIDQQNQEDNIKIDIEEYDLTSIKNPQEEFLYHANNLQSQIDLADGPLLKLGLFQTETGSRLLIVIHHLVIDGISWRILLEDIDTLYRQILAGDSIKLPLKTDSFKTWSKTIKEYTNSEQYQKGKLYWETQLRKESSTIKRDFPDGLNIHEYHNSEILELNQFDTKQLLTDAHAAYGTQINELLMSAFLLAVNKKFGLDNLCIDLEGHGREEIAAGINIGRTIGWFTSIYPVLLERNGEDVSNVVRNIKETLRAVPNKGIDYLIAQYTDVAPLEQKSNAGISFNYLGQFESAYENLQILKENKGNEISLHMEQHYDWNVIGWVSEEKLKLELVYSTQQYKKETIASFIEVFKESLKDIINHCCQRNEVTLTPSDLTHNKLSIEDLDQIQSNLEIDDVYTLSPTQEGMLFHSVLEPESKVYFDQKILSLKGNLNTIAVEKSMEALVKHHEVFRTVFLHKNLETPIQVVLKERKLDFIYKDIQEECERLSIDDAVNLYITEDKSKGFNLSEDILMRVTLLKVQEEEYRMIWSHHHIVMDGWCTSILWNDFKNLYSGFTKNDPIQLESSPKYSQYIQWLEQLDKDASKEYWSTYLENYEHLASLPKRDVDFNALKSYDLRSNKHLVSKEKTNVLQKISKNNAVTLSTIFQTIWGVVLAKYNNVDDVVFGNVVSGRTSEIAGIENIVGLFINTLPVRVRYDEEDTLETLLKKTQASAFESEPHHYHSLLDIQENSELGNGLFDHILVFENYPISENIKGVEDKKNGFSVTDVDIFEQTNYDFNVIIIPGEEIQIQIDYNQNVYSQATIHQILSHFDNVLEQLVLDKDSRISKLKLVSEEEKNVLQQKLNNTQINYPKDLNIVDLFLKQVDKNPKNIAIKFGDSAISYQELHEKSSKVACVLREFGVKNDSIIGLLMDRSIDTIIGMLGILKAGGAYLPIDINYPDDRKEYIIQDSRTSLILTTINFEDIHKLKGDFQIQYIEHAFEKSIGDKDLAVNNVSNPSDLCYVIYTSGTTGNPKGVMIEHRNVVRLFFNENPLFDFGSNDTWTMFHSHCFDFSVWEIYGALLFGGKLIIIPQLIAKDTKQYLDIVKQEGVTVLNQTPSAFYNLIQAELSCKETSLGLRYVIFGGEALNPRKLKSWKEKYPNTKLINMFGITETTVHVTYKEITEHEIQNNISNIGKPISTLSTIILDKYQNLTPKGVIGELYVGGSGIARGYLNKPELTAEKFIPNPYNPEEKLYRSGDLARILDSWELEYKGRIDHQIQLRGYRIELGEIENKILTHPKIEEAVVTFKERAGDKYVLAYYKSADELDRNELRRFLLDKLPDYMIPSYFIALTEIPLTSNGKLNTKALPEPELEVIEASSKPKNEIQKELVEIWSGILEIEGEKIGIHSNFFDIGGNSLKLMKMVDKINATFNAEITVAQVFAYPEISMLAQFLSNETNNKTESEEETDIGNFELMNDTINLLNQF
ncbi:non-ribosomal peptide synthetase [Aquimarina mytili]|uniref:Amino acid adenylation domain-containing protein n=1 Tax=Aquimarina mytili TaxID=874423 RepID=A0A936ZUP4_9FLAO|nr:non-ribosomal peptide synthetase [Aquimarina mytili]MBL0685919.1 amino acid adenylation domain-containing protein [Aquimarina mytili]